MSNDLAESAVHNAAADVAGGEVAAGVAGAQRVHVLRAVLAAALDRGALLHRAACCVDTTQHEQM